MPQHSIRDGRHSLLRAFAPLHRTALGVAWGVVLGSLIALPTLVLVVKGGAPHPNLNLLAHFFWGYSVSWAGVALGFVWGGILGFVMGWGFALVRNAAVWVWLAMIRWRAQVEQSDFLDHL